MVPLAEWTGPRLSSKVFKREQKEISGRITISLGENLYFDCSSNSSLF